MKKTGKKLDSGLTEIKDLGLRSILKRLADKVIDEDIEGQAKKISKEVLSKVAPKGKFPYTQSHFSFAPMPTNLCRVSPFFPIATQKLHDRQYIQEMIITDSSWGQILYTGAKLSVYDEDVLLAVLGLLNDIKRRRIKKVEGDKFSYSYEGPVLPILRLMGISRPGKTNYNRVMRSLKLLLGAVVELRIYKRSSGKREIEKTVMTNLLSFAEFNHSKNKLLITVNPYFYECFINESVTLIDVCKRSRLKSPISKSLFRFIQSHKLDNWEGHYLTLSASLNLDMDLAAFKLRDRIRRAIRELIKNDLLRDGSGFKKENMDVVKLLRFPHKKKLRRLN